MFPFFCLDVNKNSEAQSSHFVNLKNIAVEDNVEVKLGSSEDKGSLRTCDIIDQVNESTKLSVSKEIKGEFSSLVIALAHVVFFILSKLKFKCFQILIQIQQ